MSAGFGPKGGARVSDPRTYNQRIEDELEDAWLAGEISHADACAELDELDNRP